jgi:hypothetical protein
MPDLNKFQKLRSVGYQIRGCCSLCVHGNFGGDGRPNMTKQGYPGYGWGPFGAPQSTTQDGAPRSSWRT